MSVVTTASPDGRTYDVLWHHLHGYTYRRDTVETHRQLSSRDVAGVLSSRYGLAAENIRVDAVREVDSR